MESLFRSMSRYSSDEYSNVVREHQASLRSYVRSLGVDLAWVDDVAQEVFVLAYRKQDKIREDVNVGAWLRGIAKNVVLNEISKKHRRQRLLDERIPEMMSQLQESHSDKSYGDIDWESRRKKALMECIAKLTERSQKVVQARYFEEKTSEEIAQTHSMTANAVRLVLFNVRKKLAICLRQQTEIT